MSRQAISGKNLETYEKQHKKMAGTHAISFVHNTVHHM